MLKVKDIRAGYEGVQIINGISIEVPDHKIVSIVGANGVGKTTTLRVILGLLPLTGGEVEFDDKKISGMPTNKIVDCGIALVPEGRQLFNQMTVEENLDVGSCTKKNRANREQNKEEMFSIFPRLKERAKQMAGTLSGGEQQMLATARALMTNPKLLIMDEPSWGLAPILVAKLFETIRNVCEKGTSVLIVEQNVSKTLQISDWSYVIEHGNVGMQGVGKDLLLNDDLKKAYLGI